MHAVVPSICPRRWLRVAVLGAIAAGLAGCSSETNRFGDGVFSNPYTSKPGSDVTGSVPPAQPAPVGQVYSAQPLPPPNAARPATIPPTGQAGGGSGMASYTPASYPPPAAGSYNTAAAGQDVTGTVKLPPPPPRQGSTEAGWNWEGGTAVVVGPGENVDSLSRKYGVPAQALMQANGVTNPAMIQPGQRIVIPRYNYAGAPAQPAARTPQPVPAPVASAPRSGPSAHVVRRGETLTSIARHYGIPRRQLAAANNVVPGALVRVGDRLTIPGHVAGRGAPPAVAPPRSQATARAPGPQMAAGEPTLSARMATPTADAAEANPRADSPGSPPAFRWPVRGRVITGFGAKPNGQQNDGINLAVPEGTAVRAAEDGVVAYAGSELKGYGNLILVRHANGFVTAYAHASEIMVKRNDEVRRGQVIAKSGQSGTVTTPQLHFEIRKGATPVDPMQFLPAG